MQTPSHGTPDDSMYEEEPPSHGTPDDSMYEEELSSSPCPLLLLQKKA